MTPRERKARNEAYLARARDIALAAVLPGDAALHVHSLPDVNETAEQDGAYVECVMWVPVKG